MKRYFIRSVQSGKVWGPVTLSTESAARMRGYGFTVEEWEEV